MVLGSFKKQTWLSQQSCSDRVDTAGTIVMTRRKSMPWLVLCLAASGVVAIAPSALSQSATPGRSESVSQQVFCTRNPQGLRCHPANHASEVGIASPTATSSSSPAAPSQRHASKLHSFELHSFEPISAEQMERLSNVLLGLLYFVLPAGFGLGLFLHDRHQSSRAAVLEAQIKLLEKLWKQSPQAE